MNQTKLIGTAFSLCLLILLASRPAEAVVTKNDSRCVAKTVEQIHAHLVNYANYKNIDGTNQGNLKYPIEVPMPGGFETYRTQVPLLNMTRSEPTFRPGTTHSSNSNTDAIIWIVLQPYTLDQQGDESLYPRFYIHCQSVWDSNGRGFSHSCQWIPPAYSGSQPNQLISEFLAGRTLSNFFTSYGVGSRHGDNTGHVGFSSSLRVEPQGCPEGQSHLQYTFSIEPNAEDIRQIKPVVMHRFIGRTLRGLSNVPGIGPILTSLITPRVNEAAETSIAPLFNENDPNNMYGWYYSEYYNAWANAIRDQ